MCCKAPFALLHAHGVYGVMVAQGVVVPLVRVQIPIDTPAENKRVLAQAMSAPSHGSEWLVLETSEVFLYQNKCQDQISFWHIKFIKAQNRILFCFAYSQKPSPDETGTACLVRRIPTQKASIPS